MDDLLRAVAPQKGRFVLFTRLIALLDKHLRHYGLINKLKS